MEKIIIVGFGGHGKSVADIIKRNGDFEIIGYTDVSEQNTQYKYLGTDTVLQQYLNNGIKHVALGIGYLGRGEARQRIYHELKNIGFSFPVIVDPSAVISEDVTIGEGTVVGKCAVINTEATIGKMCIINSHATVEHECTVGDFSHISVGSVLCGQVKVHNGAFVGANAVVIQCREVKEGITIPAGSTFR